MKRIIIALLLLLVAGCTSETIVLEEVPNNDISGMTTAEIPTEDTTPYYDFTEDETKIILGHEITIIDLSQNAEVIVQIDGITGKIIETKNEELINGMKISINKIDSSDINNFKVTLKIEELELENNQYIITKNVRTRIDNKDIILTESRSTGYISILVYDINEMRSEESNIASGETVELNGLSITNLKNYYKVNQYALVKVQES